MLSEVLVLHSASVNAFGCLKYKNSNTQNYLFFNFRISMNLGTSHEVGSDVAGFSEQGVNEDIWAQERRGKENLMFIGPRIMR